MTIQNLIDELNEIKNEYGNRTVYTFDSNSLLYNEVNYIKLILANDFNSTLTDDQDYVNSFTNLIGNVLII